MDDFLPLLRSSLVEAGTFLVFFPEREDLIYRAALDLEGDLLFRLWMLSGIKQLGPGAREAYQKAINERFARENRARPTIGGRIARWLGLTS